MAHAGPAPASGAAVGPLEAPAALELRSTEEVVSAGALERFAGCPVKWLVEDVLRPEKLEPDPEQMVRGSYAHRVLELTFRRLRERTGSRSASRRTTWPRPSGSCSRRSTSCAASSACRPTRRACARRCGGWSSTCCATCATRPDATACSSPSTWSCGSGSTTPSTRASSWRTARGCGAMIDRVDTWNGHALVRDYKSGKVDTYKVADWERERRFQAALYMLVVEQALGLRAAGGVYVPLGGTEPNAARARGGRAGRASWAATSGTTTACPRAEFDEHIDVGAARRSPRWPSACAAASSPRARTPAPTAAAARTPRSAGWRSDGLHRRAAAGDRAPRRLDLLVSAGAGTGKTSVLVERFVRAVLDDGVAVDAILAITFTEKAAAQLKSRVRARLRRAERARREARAAEAAWISTIHGFCARLLRTHALAAGIDPEFRVLDGVESERLAHRRVRPRAGATSWEPARTPSGCGCIAALHARPAGGHGAHRLRAPAQPRPRRRRSCPRSIRPRRRRARGAARPPPAALAEIGAAERHDGRAAARRSSSAAPRCSTRWRRGEWPRPPS